MSIVAELKGKVDSIDSSQQLYPKYGLYKIPTTAVWKMVLALA